MQPDLQSLYAAWRTDPNQLTSMLTLIRSKAERQVTRIDQRLDAEDVAQEITLAVHKALRTDFSFPVKNLVWRITKAKITDAQRKIYRTIQSISLDTKELDTPAPSSLIDMSRYAEVVARADDHGISQRTIDMLIEGYDIDEIARMQRLSTSLLRSRLRRLKNNYRAESRKAA